MKYKILDGFKLKLIMAILMMIDHIGQFIPNSPFWFHWVGRIVAPVFLFLVTEGYKHTKNKTAYMNRLFIWAAIMFLGNSTLYMIFEHKPFIQNNIFFSMALGIALLTAFEKKSNENQYKLKDILLIISILLLSSFSEGSLMTTAMILIFHYLKEDEKKMSIAFIILSVAFIPNIQWMMVFALPFILMYNGKRGKNIKYFFYLFYPLHIWVLYIISYYLGK